MQKTANGSSPVFSGYQALYGVEIRDPTCDVRLVEFCLALPNEQFQRDGVSRRLIRQAMVGRLPEEVLWNPGRGLQAADWLERIVAARDEFLQAVDEMAHCGPVRELIDLEGLRRAVEQSALSASEGRGASSDLRTFLERGFMVGSFVRWFESGR